MQKLPIKINLLKYLIATILSLGLAFFIWALHLNPKQLFVKGVAKSITNLYIIGDIKEVAFSLSSIEKSVFPKISLYSEKRDLIFSTSRQSNFFLLPISMAITFGGSDTHPVGYLIFWTDITNPLIFTILGIIAVFLIVNFFSKTLEMHLVEHFRLHSEKRETERLADLSRQVAHDIKSPLTALMALERHLDTLLPPDKAEISSNAIKRLLSISNDLLSRNVAVSDQTAFSISKINSKRSISRILEELINEKAPRLSKTGIKCQIKCEQSMILPTYLYESDIARHISNLLDNSIDACMSTDMRNVWISVDKSERSELLISVTDTGMGISSDKVQLMGQRGFTTKEHGNGLGLWALKSWLNEFGGNIQIISKPYRGTQISMIIPREKAT